MMPDGTDRKAARERPASPDDPVEPGTVADWPPHLAEFVGGLG